MSYASDVKAELACLEVNKQCCKLAEMAGFLCVSSSISLAGGGTFRLVASTENAAVARRYKKMIEQYFSNEVVLGVGDSQMPRASGTKGRNRYYLFIEPDQKSAQILREIGKMLVKEGSDYFSDGIYTPIVKTKCCKKSFLRGLFMGCGTMSDPKKSYHLEFVIDKETLANDVKRLICSFDDMSASLIKRKNDNIVYMKKAFYISDMLGIMGADEAEKRFEEIKLSKELMVETQRLMNCDNANDDRMLVASEEQRRWIKTIDNKEGLDWLPPQLKEVAQLRLEHPDAGLTEIGEMLDPPIKKSGVNKRFARLKAIAEELSK